MESGSKKYLLDYWIIHLLTMIWRTSLLFVEISKIFGAQKYHKWFWNLIYVIENIQHRLIELIWVLKSFESIHKSCSTSCNGKNFQDPTVEKINHHST